MGLIEAAILVVAGVGIGPPLRSKQLAVVFELHVYSPVRHGHKVTDAAIAVDHQSQGGGLYPAHRQYALIAGLAPEQGEQAAHVHADQPVGSRAPQR